MTTVIPRVGIVGSGPAAIYTAQKLLKRHSSLTVDVFERHPVPFGLVRFGVAPDHQDVKNVIGGFTQTFHKFSPARLRFFGNCAIGSSQSHTGTPLSRLLASYHATVLAYGAANDRPLGLADEFTLRGIYSANQIVGWYNGAPEFAHLTPHHLLPIRDDVTATAAAAPRIIVIGQGNVALDVARILLLSRQALHRTDTPSSVVQYLHGNSQSGLRNQARFVRVVGRRGPLNVRFTIKELRAMFKLEEDAQFWLESEAQRSAYLEATNVVGGDDAIGAARNTNLNLDRARLRLTKAMHAAFASAPIMSSTCRNDDATTTTANERAGGWTLNFHLKPRRLIAHPTQPERIAAIEFESGGQSDFSAQQHHTGGGGSPDSGVVLSCDAMIRATGYAASQLEPNMPCWDAELQRLANERGRCVSANQQRTEGEGLYCVGWIKRGPVGVILTTLADAEETSGVILDDISELAARIGSVEEARQSLIDSVAPHAVSFAQWEAIDAAERANGQPIGKPREKITNLAEMLETAGSTQPSPPNSLTSSSNQSEATGNEDDNSTRLK